MLLGCTSCCMTEKFLHVQARMPRKWKFLTAAVILLHVGIAAYIAAGSRRSSLFDGVRLKGLGMGTTGQPNSSWNPQVCTASGPCFGSARSVLQRSLIWHIALSCTALFWLMLGRKQVHAAQKR